MYLAWDEKNVADFSDTNINNLYDQGYVFTRLGKGKMQQTRSIRVDLEQFELSSENRRVLKKVEQLKLSTAPLPYGGYHWSIGKLAKDFYETKFGAGIFSAQKIKELITSAEKSNFNRLLFFNSTEQSIGYCIARETNELLHYCYPFYELRTPNSELTNVGIGMMTMAITWAKAQGKKYVYLGSAQRPSDTYKLQFAGVEWFDNTTWIKNIDQLKAILTN